MTPEDYRGVTLRAVPYQLADDRRWVARVNIFDPMGGATRIRTLTLNTPTFETEEEAAKHSILLGRYVIDGESR